MRTTLCLLAVPFCVACGRPPEAPKELNDLSSWLYREWDNEDPDVMAVGITNLVAFLEKQDLEAGLLDRAWELDRLTNQDVSDIEHPKGADPSEALGVAVAGVARWKVTDHARLQMERDQLPAEPSADAYVRKFPDVDDASCFLDDPDCDPISSVNDITRRNALMTVDFVLYKDFRWVETDGGPALAARSWLDRSWEGEKGSTEVTQSYAIDLWIPVGKEVWRYQSLWSQSRIPGANDAMTLGVLKKSIDDIYEAGDTAIEDLYY